MRTVAYLLWAEARLGELLRGILRKYVGSIEGTNVPKQEPSLPPGITKKQSFYAHRIGELVPAIPKEKTGRGKKTPRDSGTFPESQRLSEFRKHDGRIFIFQNKPVAAFSCLKAHIGKLLNYINLRPRRLFPLPHYARPEK